MTAAEYEKRHAIQLRYGERVRWEERNRAFEIIEMKVDDKDEATAEMLWGVAAEIMRHKA
jgi:L-ribulose-5-phosphate 3-epimerase UlaE